MKRILTLSAMLLAGTGIFAQNATVNLPKHVHKIRTSLKLYPYIAQLFATQENGRVQKTTAIKQRVTAISSYDLTGSPMITDSIQFKYTGTNGSKFNYDYMYYDYYLPGGTAPGYFPYNYTKKDVMADTATSYLDNGGPGLDVSETFKTLFNTNGDMTHFSYQYYTGLMLTGGYRYSAAYDGQGKLDRYTQLEWNTSTSAWDTIARQVFYYNGQNKLVTDTTFQYDLGDWEPLFSENFLYDGQGRNSGVNQFYYTGITWVSYLNYIHTFYPNDKLKTLVLEDGSTMQPVVKDTFAYDPTNSFSILISESEYDLGNWIPTAEYAKHLNTSGQPDTFYLKQWNGTSWDITDKIAFTYNSFGNPVTGTDLVSNGPSFDENSRSYYYYEEFNDAGKVKNVAINNQLVIYPNPASSVLNIHWKGSVTSSAAVIIYNAAGQVQYRDVFSHMQQTEQVPVANLIPGIYFINILDASGEVIHQQSFNKQ